MKVSLTTTQLNRPNAPPELCLVPEDHADRLLLEKLLATGETIGYGLDATTGDLLHVRIAVANKPAIENSTEEAWPGFRHTIGAN